MKIFENFNESGKCHVCGTNKPGKTVLVPLDSTSKDRIEQAVQIHLDCLELRAKVLPNGDVLIYQIDNDLADICKLVEEVNED